MNSDELSEHQKIMQRGVEAFRESQGILEELGELHKAAHELSLKRETAETIEYLERQEKKP